MTFLANKALSNTKQILNSLAAWPKALVYIFQNRWIQKYILIAVGLNFLIFIALIPLAFYLADLISTSVLAYFSGLAIYQGISILLTILLWLGFIFLISKAFGIVSSVVNAPVYSVLTSQIIQREFPQIPTSNLDILSEVSNALNFELKKLFLSFGVLLILFSLNFIPFIGSFLYFWVLLLQIIFIASLDAFEPYHSQKKYSFRRRIIEIGKQPFSYWPFMLIVGILGSIPFLNIFFTPISVVGVTKLVKNLDKDLK